MSVDCTIAAAAAERHVVMFSGGIGSWAAAKRAVDRHGAGDLTLLFCDTLIEDPDLYRFLDAAAANVFRNLPPALVRLADGRTPWQVFRDERFLRNSRFDPCSKILKRQLADRWLRENCDPATTTVYVGIDWTEINRFDDGAGNGLRPRRAAEGWRYEAPMIEPPYLSKTDMLEWLRREGLQPPRLYELGFAHNNCGGRCCKAGQAQWALLLRAFPDRYHESEAEENALREMLGDVSMLTDRSGGQRRPLPLSTLRARIEAGEQTDMFDLGGCGCMIDA